MHSATDPGTSVAGTVGLLAKAWGTEVTLDLSKVHGPVECELVAVSKSGERRVVMNWLARLDVDVVNGRTLLSIPV